MRLSNFRKLNGRGDTIVEVMVVLAVLGLALSISYSTANRSLLNARQAQETSEAATILQAQVEDLRALSSVPRPVPVGGPDIFVNAPFCVQQSGSSFTVIKPAPAAPNPSPLCGGGTLYNVSVVYCGGAAAGYSSCPPSTNNDTFIATASWPDVSGQGTDNVKLTYRAHP